MAIFWAHARVWNTSGAFGVDAVTAVCTEFVFYTAPDAVALVYIEETYNINEH